MSIDFSKFTKKQIVAMSNKLAPIANAKLKEMRDLGYDKLNNSMIKKYNTLTSYSKQTMKNVTKKGYFRKGGEHSYTKDQLIKRYELMNEFINNDYASVAYTKRHLEKMRDKWSLSDDKIKDMFTLYREYGYDNFGDSDSVLQSFSKIMGDTESLDESMDAREYLENVLQSIADDLDNQGKSEAEYISALQNAADFLPS